MKEEEEIYYSSCTILLINIESLFFSSFISYPFYGGWLKGSYKMSFIACVKWLPYNVGSFSKNDLGVPASFLSERKKMSFQTFIELVCLGGFMSRLSRVWNAHLTSLILEEGKLREEFPWKEHNCDGPKFLGMDVCPVQRRGKWASCEEITVLVRPQWLNTWALSPTVGQANLEG